MSRRLAPLTILAILMLVFGLPARARATPLYTNFGPGSSYNIPLGNFIGDDLLGDNAAEAASFVAGAGGAVADIQIALSGLFGSNTKGLTVTLQQDAGGLPGLILETFSIGPALLPLFGANNPPLLLASVVNPVLSAGSRYWVTAEQPSGSDSLIWNWNSTGDANPTASSVDGGASWFNLLATPGAFAVDGVTAVPVPEAGTLTLVALGALIPLVGRMRRPRILPLATPVR